MNSVIVKVEAERWDYSCDDFSPINLWAKYYDTSFEEYFETIVLNPDYAPVGTQEQLNKLLNVFKTRDIIIKCENTGGDENCPCATIKSYLINSVESTF